jgi:hypothetical protein
VSHCHLRDDPVSIRSHSSATTTAAVLSSVDAIMIMEGPSIGGNPGSVYALGVRYNVVVVA